MKQLFATVLIILNSKSTITDGICYCCLHVIGNDDCFLCVGYHTLSTKSDTPYDNTLPVHDNGHLRLGWTDHCILVSDKSFAVILFYLFYLPVWEA